MNNIIPAILKRKSSMSFSAKAIEKEKINTLFEAASLAPSAFNEQPWRFVYALHGTMGFDTMMQSVMEGNKPWAQNAGMLVLMYVKRTSSYNGKENYYAEHDSGMAIGNLMLQAAELALVSHPFAGFDKVQIAKDLNISDEYKVMTMVAIGYEGNVEDLSEDAKKRHNSPRNRKVLEEVVREM